MEWTNYGDLMKWATLKNVVIRITPHPRPILLV